MPKRNYLATPVKQAIVQAKEGGSTDRAVADLFNVNQSTVSRIYSRHRNEGSVSRQQKSGRPRKLSERQERAAVRQVKTDPNKTSSDFVAYVFGKKILYIWGGWWEIFFINTDS